MTEFALESTVDGPVTQTWKFFLKAPVLFVLRSAIVISPSVDQMMMMRVSVLSMHHRSRHRGGWAMIWFSVIL